MIRRRAILGGVPALAGWAATGAGTAGRRRAAAPVLVELFTSEGCSSCPPADAVLGRLAGDPGVLALAFHVTYWDRLGWPDTFGDPAFTRRQRDYAGRLGLGSVYTPQMVVGGTVDVVGSDAPAVAAAIRREAGRAAPIALDAGGAALPGVDGLDKPARLWMAAYDGHARVAVARGENAGRTLEHDNIVRELVELGEWDGVARTIGLPLDRLRREGRAGVAVVAQDAASGRVLAAGGLAL